MQGTIRTRARAGGFTQRASCLLLFVACPYRERALEARRVDFGNELQLAIIPALQEVGPGVP